jgi:hypothetical protein
MLHYLAFFFLITTLFQHKTDWMRLLKVQAIVGLLVALYAVGQAINWPLWMIDPPTGKSLSGTLGNPAYMGIYMAFSVFCAAFLAREGGKKRSLWAIVGIIEAIVFLTAQNRGSFVAISVGGIIGLGIWFFQKKRSVANIVSLGIGFIAIIGIGTWLVFSVKGGKVITDFKPRLWTWESSLAGIIERPITGWGAENFPFIFDKYYNPKHYRIESWFDRAHSTPLEYLTIGGIPLFLAYFGIFFVLYRKLFRKKNEGLLPLFAAMPLAYAINGLVLFETLPLYVIFFLIIGFVDAYAGDFQNTGINPKKTRDNYALKNGAFIICALLTLTSLYATVYMPLKKNILMLETARTDGKTDVEVFQEHMNALSYPSPVGAVEELQGLMTVTIGYFDYLMAQKLAMTVPKEKIAEIMRFNDYWYEKISPSAPGLKLVYIRVTSLLAAYRQTKDPLYLAKADELIAKGVAISPTRIEFVRFAMASAALRGDTTAYKAAFKKGITLLPDLDWEPDIRKFIY